MYLNLGECVGLANDSKGIVSREGTVEDDPYELERTLSYEISDLGSKLLNRFRIQHSKRAGAETRQICVCDCRLANIYL